ncbi:type VI secretion system tube protein Hcp [Dyadobacter pollutisoli]|jgi:type VI protein secretion system component Hcp|uniref:Type VI secretion system tube protein Hcp n=1 Tax=Dyadobacter pollutisoli TaxID=2910158 RepID=A0A9E8NCU0_9BACT|nr:type VI secretion system tube protein Hcp [Dyadobacter pollutisoli]WAC12636.1 type VI secretion system tube protein Hcp [Dyadobacter pollutisoli]
MKTKHFYYVLFTLLLSSFVSKAQEGIYLSYPGITDDLGTGPHEGEVPVLAFSYGFSSTATRTSSGTPNFQDISFTKYSDASSSDFMTHLVSSQPTDDVELRIYRTISGNLTLIQTYQYKGVKITSFSAGGSAGELSGSACSTCTGLTENITFLFNGIQIGTFSDNF